jgi:hypothetical protein
MTTTPTMTRVEIIAAVVSAAAVIALAATGVLTDAWTAVRDTIWAAMTTHPLIVGIALSLPITAYGIAKTRSHPGRQD